MISPESRSIEWIKSVAEENNAHHLTLVEKVIRAFSLLESLARSGCPFIFKGGSSLMLYFDTKKRMSIDIDIICPPGTNIEKYLGMYAEEYGFTNVESVDRIYRTDVPKTHAKYHYQVSYQTSAINDTILLDVLTEENNYHITSRVPIKSPFLKTEGEDILVAVPSKEDLLGDKLSAFAPHTTGIPFFKGTKNCSMEIIKQMFDISSLFDIVDDLSWASKTYSSLTAIEKSYRHIENTSTNDILQDTINAALCISTNGFGNENEFKLYADGVARVRNFIHSEKYNMTSATRDAAKVAYVAACVMKGVNAPEHYSAENASLLRPTKITAGTFSRVNNLRNSIPEAFFYWSKVAELLG